MSKDKVLVLYSGALKFASTVPILAFLLALTHELGLSLGLGINVLHFYVPTDFLAISIQFVLLSLLPYTLQVFDAALGGENSLGPIGLKRLKWFVYGCIILILLSWISSFLFGFPEHAFTSSLGALGLIAIPFAVAKYKFFDGVEAPASAMLMVFVFSFYSGSMEGLSILKGTAKSMPVVGLTANPSQGSKFFLVRLLSAGALVIDSDARISYVQHSTLISATTELDREGWQGAVCEIFGQCEFLKGLRDSDGVLRIDIPIGKP